MPDIQTVALSHFNVNPRSLALVAAIAALGFRNVLLCGGALRDDYMGLADKISDYDMVADFGTQPRPPDDMARYVTQHLADVTGMQLAPFPGEDPGTGLGACPGMTLKFRQAGKPVSLSLNENCGPMAEWVTGDAPINSIALHAGGTLLAHPLFEEHAKARIYQPFSDIPPARAKARLEHLQRKIAGLKMG
ncbi:MAG: hypothetical protein PW788_05190 [Micavibrio sp.]|nr:hypothetical protein [Micavibrio sp.]